MIRTIRTIRRSIRAALTAGTQLVTAVRGSHYQVLVALYRAIDQQADVRITYRDSKGADSERTITPHHLTATNAGHITVRAHDHRDAEDTTFRTDRIQIDTAARESAVTTHPLLAHIPATDIPGTIEQSFPVGEGVVTVIATTPDARFGTCEVTAWRPVPQWEIDMLAQEFPGEPQPLAVSVSSRTLQDDAEITWAVNEATEFLTAYLARATAA